MSTAYVGEIRIFAGNFAPVDWAFCQGQLLAISQNAALFDLIGTTYGGDGQTNFALPDLRGRFPVHLGQGSGLSGYVIGQQGGAETVTLTTNQLPIHNHSAVCSPGTGVSETPVNSYWCTDPTGATAAYNQNENGAMAAAAIGSTGGGQAHDNMAPYLALSFIIALNGVFPTQT